MQNKDETTKTIWMQHKLPNGAVLRTVRLESATLVDGTSSAEYTYATFETLAKALLEDRVGLIQAGDTITFTFHGE